MHRLRRLALLAPLALLAGCGPSLASKQLLVGTWKADFRASWTISKDAFLKDTLRGAAAYPKDEAEREKAIHDEMQAFVGSMQVKFADDDQATVTTQGKDQGGKWEVLSTDGQSMQVKLLGRDYTFTFQSDDEVHMIPKKGPTIVFRR